MALKFESNTGIIEKITPANNTFRDLLNATNFLIEQFETTVLTIEESPNTSINTGNLLIDGIFTITEMVAEEELRGGDIANSGLLTITSESFFSNTFMINADFMDLTATEFSLSGSSVSLDFSALTGNNTNLNVTIESANVGLEAFSISANVAVVDGNDVSIQSNTISITVNDLIFENVTISAESIDIATEVDFVSNMTFNNVAFDGSFTNLFSFPGFKNSELILNYSNTVLSSNNAGICVERGEEPDSMISWDEENNYWYLDYLTKVENNLNVIGSVSVLGTIEAPEASLNYAQFFNVTVPTLTANSIGTLFFDVVVPPDSHTHTIDEITDAGNAMYLDVGTNAFDVVVLGANGALPSLDGSQLLNTSGIVTVNGQEGDVVITWSDLANGIVYDDVTTEKISYDRVVYALQNFGEVSANINLDIANANIFDLTPTANLTITISGLVATERAHGYINIRNKDDHVITWGDNIRVSPDLELSDANTIITPFVVGFFQNSNPNSTNTTLSMPRTIANTDMIYIHVQYENSVANRPSIPGFTIIESRNVTVDGSAITEVLFEGVAGNQTPEASSNLVITVPSNTTFGPSVVSAVVLRNGTADNTSISFEIGTNNSILEDYTVANGQVAVFFGAIDGSVEVFDNWSLDDNFTLKRSLTANNAGRGTAIGVITDPGVYDIDLRKPLTPNTSTNATWTYMKIDGPIANNYVDILQYNQINNTEIAVGMHHKGVPLDDRYGEIMYADIQPIKYRYWWLYPMVNNSDSGFAHWAYVSELQWRDVIGGDDLIAAPGTTVSANNASTSPTASTPPKTYLTDGNASTDINWGDAGADDFLKLDFGSPKGLAELVYRGAVSRLPISGWVLYGSDTDDRNNANLYATVVFAPTHFTANDTPITVRTPSWVIVGEKPTEGVEYFGFYKEAANNAYLSLREIYAYDSNNVNQFSGANKYYGARQQSIADPFRLTDGNSGTINGIITDDPGGLKSAFVYNVTNGLDIKALRFDPNGTSGIRPEFYGLRGTIDNFSNSAVWMERSEKVIVTNNPASNNVSYPIYFPSDNLWIANAEPVFSARYWHLEFDNNGISSYNVTMITSMIKMFDENGFNLMELGNKNIISNIDVTAGNNVINDAFSSYQSPTPGIGLSFNNAVGQLNTRGVFIDIDFGREVTPTEIVFISDTTRKENPHAIKILTSPDGTYGNATPLGVLINHTPHTDVANTDGLFYIHYPIYYDWLTSNTESAEYWGLMSKPAATGNGFRHTNTTIYDNSTDLNVLNATPDSNNTFFSYPASGVNDHPGFAGDWISFNGANTRFVVGTEIIANTRPEFIRCYSTNALNYNIDYDVLYGKRSFTDQGYPYFTMKVIENPTVSSSNGLNTWTVSF